MKQIDISGRGGPEKLVLHASPDPLPKANELRVRVKASGINFDDKMVGEVLFPEAPKLPCVVDYEASGTVDAAGPDADSRWIVKHLFDLTRSGGYA